MDIKRVIASCNWTMDKIPVRYWEKRSYIVPRFLKTFEKFEKENDMTKKAFQDYYTDEFANCYGCGRLNKHGLQIKSYWNGEESVCHFQPKHYHTGGFPGYVYGGLIACIIDCHAAGTASAIKYQYNGQEMGSDPPLRFVTASLHVDYLAPTPIDEILELRGNVKEIKGRKVIVAITLSAKGQVCVKGEVVVVQIPEDFSHK